jgi:hypothetical protein
VGELFGRHRDPNLVREVIELVGKGGGVHTQYIQHSTLLGGDLDGYSC